MMGSGWRKYGRATLPAVLTLVVMLGLWAYGRWGYASAPTIAEGSARPGTAIVIGWLMALFVLAPTFLVVWIAAAAPPVFPVPRISFSYVLLADIGGVLLLLVGGGAVGLPLATVGALYLLLAAWLGVWGALAAFLRRWGAGWSAVLPLILSSLCMAAPIVAMPLIRSAPATGAWSQGKLIAVITHACPMLGALDALQTGGRGIRPDWGTLPIMYRYSGLGQSIPAELPHWWLTAIVYGSAALILGAFSRSRRPSPIAPESIGSTPAPAPTPAAAAT